MELQEYRQKVADAILDKTEEFNRAKLVDLKENFRALHTAVSSLYAALTRKGVLAEDPYKNDEKVGEIKIPDNGPIPEQNKRDILGQRISDLDNQLDFLVNFYPFSIENFAQDKIRLILGLVNYIDWQHLTPDMKSSTTAALATTLTEFRQTNQEPVTATMVNDAIANAVNAVRKIYAGLKEINDFNREDYKNKVRLNAVNALDAASATPAVIKKTLAKNEPRLPFYAELVDEVVREDFRGDEALREKTLKILAISEEKKKEKKAPNFRPLLIEGINAVGGAWSPLQEILDKLKDNNDLVQNQKKGLWAKIKLLLAQVANIEPEPVFYEVMLMDSDKGVSVRKKVEFAPLCDEIEHKIKILAAVAARGTAAGKLEAMNEEQLTDLLQRNIRDTKNLHKTLTGLDDYFKQAVEGSEKSKVRGIKPELGVLKNSFTVALQKLQDYRGAKEEEEQFKKLGIEAS